MSYFLRWDSNATMIGCVLVHNKTAAQNRAQIAAMLTLTEVRQWQPVDEAGNRIPFMDGDVPLRDDAGNIILSSYDYRVFRGLARPHEVFIWQIIPVGVTPPSNLGLLNSHKVFYSAQDTPAGVGPKHWNWALSRPLAYEGADLVLHVTAPANLTAAKMALALGRSEGWLEGDWGRLVRWRVLRHGLLREDLPVLQAITEYKQRLLAAGEGVA